MLQKLSGSQARAEILKKLFINDRKNIMRLPENAIKQEVAANTMICLVNRDAYLLGHQIKKLANNFENKVRKTEK